MKATITIIILTTLSGCKSQIDPETAYREKEKHFYTNRPDYWEQMDELLLPQDYSTERKLLIIAHGFDPNVRLVLADQLSKEMEGDPVLMDEVFAFLNSNDPALAWSAAWISDKCIANGPDPMPVYKRDDVRLFENTHHKYISTTKNGSEPRVFGPLR